MKLLLLAGSGEAREIAAALSARSWPETIASISGGARDGPPLALPTRRGGFGGRAGFEAFLDAERIGAVLDATHPFAHRITRRTAEICAARELPYLLVERPPWRPGPGDRWTMLTHEAEAARHIPPGATVFLATGRGSLPGFANLAGREIICRQIEPPEAPFPYPGGRYQQGTPPFSEAEEIALFKRLGVDFLVVRNAGGERSATKLAAARALGLPVLMIARPSAPDCPRVETVAEALDWVARLGALA
ncbi:cobalt-precorrin-6A reductase [Maritimibacter sp. 55A14]|uniref:precorrin-6A/cobalt-precorrin-6A reductase n=1 Tax=Maritimibacter sp. 55A14 TaxID=2174844 RepID=UPI000D610893|nr:precorrin-6A/cobalt-precorrin-6A reductase [Maritimibacter sp. 55A14]PWE33131.1 cobalt-precorrin-6A reductase [Maritimibacter sp. 55A14]